MSKDINVRIKSKRDHAPLIAKVLFENGAIVTGDGAMRMALLGPTPSLDGMIICIESIPAKSPTKRKSR